METAAMKCPECDGFISRGDITKMAAHLTHFHTQATNPYRVKCLCGELIFADRSDKVEKHFETCGWSELKNLYYDSVMGVGNHRDLKKSNEATLGGVIPAGSER